eukprot:2010971-Pleurochrysis_carterae.AAC.1
MGSDGCCPGGGCPPAGRRGAAHSSDFGGFGTRAAAGLGMAAGFCNSGLGAGGCGPGGWQE